MTEKIETTQAPPVAVGQRREPAPEVDQRFEAERLAVAVHYANDVIFLMDETWRIVEANNRAFAEYGYTAEELRRLPPGGLRPAALCGGLKAQLALLDSPDGGIFETVHQRKDGTTFPVEISGRKVAVGGHYFILGIFRDITRRRQAQAALIASETRYRRLFESAKDGILILDAKTGMVVDVNPFLINLLGFPRERFLEKAVWDLGFFKDIVANHASFAKLQENEYIRYEDKPLETADGRRIEVEFVSNVYLVDQQKVIQCNVRDITERRRAEERLRKLSRIIEQAPLSISITDLTGAMEYVNPRFCTVTGYTPEEAFGQNPRILKSGRTRPEVYRDMWGKLTRGEIWSGELSNRRKNGEVYLETAVIAPVVDKDGRVTHYIALKDDITAQRRSADEAAARLERAQEISEIKTQFISAISHDFRTPLTAIMASAELLHRHDDKISPAKREELFDRVHSSVLRLTEMLDKVLTLNQVDAGRVDLRPVAIDLPSFMRDVIDEARLADRGAHRLESDATGDPAAFGTDVSLLRHILTNLLGNAVRYSPADSLITMRAEADSRQVKISISDRGIGIPEADRERIFRPFERGSNVGATNGTGIGLNIVQRMTKLLGGTVAVDCVEGGGSRFILLLPRLNVPGA
jgi:PAS domain S-box-containing protein